MKTSMSNSVFGNLLLQLALSVAAICLVTTSFYVAISDSLLLSTIADHFSAYTLFSGSLES